jgi:hypothetical protein
MNTRQQKFVTEYLQWGIPCLAYANAYNKPNPNGRAIESAANRLLRNPEVKQAIHDAEDRIRHQVEREIADRQALDVFTIEQKRHLLKQIATGDILVEQRYKTGDCRHCTQFIRPTINQMLRAIDLDNRMAAHYPSLQQKTTSNKKDSFPACPDNLGVFREGGFRRQEEDGRVDESSNPSQIEQQQPNAVSSLPSLKKTSIRQQNTTTETCPPQPACPDHFGVPTVSGAGVSAAADGGGTLAPDTREQQPNTTTDNTSPRPGDLPCPSQPKVGIGGGVITHDELMELLYPKEEKMQHFTTTGLKKE